MKINLLGKKKIIWLGCFLYTTNFYASSDSSSRTNSILQIQTDITSLYNVLKNSNQAQDPFGVSNKLLRLYNESNTSGIFAKVSDLPGNKIKTILDILGCGADQPNPTSVFQLLESNSPLSLKVAGFNGDFPGEIGSIHSRLNEILNIIARHNILDPMGYTTDTALENGRTIWARIKYLYNDLIDNKEEKITNNINTVYSTSKDLMLDHSQKTQTSIEDLIASAGEKLPDKVTDEELKSYPFSHAKQKITAITATLGTLGSTYVTPEESAQLTENLTKLDTDIQALNTILASIENPDVIQKFEQAQTTLNDITTQLSSNQSAADSSTSRTFCDVCTTLREKALSAINDTEEFMTHQAQLEPKIDILFESMSVNEFKEHIDVIRRYDLETANKMTADYKILENLQTAIDPIEKINTDPQSLNIFTKECQTEIQNLSKQYAPIFLSKSISAVSEALNSENLQNAIDTNKLKANTTQVIEKTQNNLNQSKDSGQKMVHLRNVIEKLDQAVQKSSEFSKEVQNECTIINDFSLTDKVTKLQKSIDHFAHNPNALTLLGKLDNAVLYKPYQIIPLLHLVQNSLTSLVYSFTGDLLSSYTQNVKTLLTNLQTVIAANNRAEEIVNLETTLVKFYVDVASHLSKELALSDKDFSERTTTLQDLEAFISKNSQINTYTLSNLIVADIPNISRIQSYTWPKLASEETINIGNFIQPGLTLMNCTHKIRQALSVYPLFLQIGYGTDNKDDLSLIGKIKSINTQIETKNTEADPYPLINYNPLILIRHLIEMYPAVSFVKQEEEKTFIQWLTEIIGSGTDVYAVEDPVNPAAASGSDPAPSGDASAPNGDASAPNGDASAPSEDPSAPNGDASAPNGDASAPSEDPSAPSGDASAPSGDASAPSENPSQSKLISLFADINETQNMLADTSSNTPLSPNVLREKLETINSKLQMIATSLNDIINAKIASLKLVSLQEDWYDYGEIFKIIINNSDISALDANHHNKLLQELYARPLLFKINGTPNIDEDTLLSKIQQNSNSGSNAIAQSWIHFQLEASNLSSLNFVSRSILEGARYLNTAFPSDANDGSANAESGANENNEAAGTPPALETTISQSIKEKIPTTTQERLSIYHLTDGFYQFINTFFLKTESPDGGSTTYALASSDPSLITTESTDPNITKALQTLNIPHADFSDRLTVVYNSITNAQAAWLPIRLEKVIEKLYKIQTNLEDLYTKINDIDSDFDFEKTMYVKTILGTTLEDHRASASIFGCLNSIITECGAQLLVNLIGTPTDYQEDSLFARLYQREIEDAAQDTSSNIQSAMSACNELANRILTNASTFTDTTPSGQLFTTASAINRLAEKISSNEALDSIIPQINSICSDAPTV